MMRIALFLLATGVAACAGAERPAPPPEAVPATPAPVASAPSAVPPVAPDAGVAPDSGPRPPTLTRRLELREPGAEPRRVVRHAFAAGSRHALRVVVSAPASRRKSAPSPRSSCGLRSTSRSSEPIEGGAARFRYTLGPIAQREPEPR